MYSGRNSGIPYFASDAVVVQVHQTAIVAFHFARVDEPLRQRRSKADVGRTSAPLPSDASDSAHLVDGRRRRLALLPRVASARGYPAAAARLADRVGEASAPNGVQESCLSASYAPQHLLQVNYPPLCNQLI